MTLNAILSAGSCASLLAALSTAAVLAARRANKTR